MRGLLQFVFGINVVFLVLLGFSFLVVEPGTGSFVIGVVTLLIVGGMLLVSGGLLFVGWDGFRTNENGE